MRKPTHRGATKRGATKRGATKRGATKRGATKRGVTKRGATKRGATKRGATKRGATKRGATKRGATKRGATKPAATKSAATKSAATKSAATKSAVSRVSPIRGMPVQTWIESKASGWQQDVIRRVVDVMVRAAPQATCSIKWGQPVLEQNGPLAFVRPAKAHVTVGFWRGSELTDPKELLTSGDRMGHLKLASADALDEGALTALIQEAVKLNATKGNPTRSA